MIYLIGGVPRCGKTTLARTLSKKLGISMVPADYLTSVEMAYISDEEFDQKFPLKSARIKYKGNDFFYSTFTPGQITDLYVKQAETAWKGIQRFAEYALSEKQDFVIEGYQIQPEAVAKLKEKEYWPQIKSLFLYKENPEEILKGIKMGNSEEDWSLQHTENNETLPKIANMISVFGKRTHAEADKHGLPAFNMELNFTEQIEKLVRELTK